MGNLSEILEAAMVLSFGISWPASIIKSYRSGTTKGKSLFFMLMIDFGYICGIVWKIIEFANTGSIRYPAVFYIINLLMVTADICLYMRNRKLDKMREAAE